jgi:hypothetical protein
VAITFRAAGPPAEEGSLRTTEQQIALALPAEYRSFLEERNGGFLEAPGFFDEDVAVEELFSAGPTPVCNLDQIEVMYERYAGSDQGVPPLLIPAGADALGNLICVSADEADAGTVYFWHHELVEDAHRSLDVGFRTFMERLRTEEEFRP